MNDKTIKIISRIMNEMEAVAVLKDVEMFKELDPKDIGREIVRNNKLRQVFRVIEGGKAVKKGTKVVLLTDVIE